MKTNYKVICGVIILVSSVLLVSCRSVASGSKTAVKLKEQASKLDETESTDAIDRSEKQLQVPTYLWSKDEREIQAMSRYLTGETKYLEGDLQGALEDYETSYNLDSTSYIGGKILTLKSLSADDSISLVDAKRLSLRYPKDARVRFIYGLMLYKENQKQKAFLQMQKAISLDPKNEMYSVNLASIYEKEGQTDKAQKVLVSIYNLSPTTNVSIALARLYYKNSQYEKALVVIKQAYSLDRLPLEGILLYAIILDKNSLKKESIDMFDQYYTMDSLVEQPSVNTMLFGLLSSLNEAYDIIEDLLSTKEGAFKPSLLLQKVYILWGMGRLEEADDILEKLHNNHPEQDKLRYILGVSKEKIKDFDFAIKVYDEISEISEYKKLAVVRVISIYISQKEYRKAISYIDKSTSNTNLTEILDKLYVVKLSILESLEDYSKAWKQAELMYKLHPENIEYLFYVGVYQEKAGKFSSAEATLKQVISINPSYSAAYNHLGYLYALRGIKLDEAESLLVTALKLKPQDPYYLDSLGWIYYMKKDYSQALKYLLMSNKILPGEPEVLEHIAETYEKLSDTKNARVYYQKMLETDKITDKEKKQVQKRLNTLD